MAPLLKITTNAAFERSFYAESLVESARFFRRDLDERGGFDEGVVFFEESVPPKDSSVKSQPTPPTFGFDISFLISQVQHLAKTADIFRIHLLGAGVCSDPSRPRWL